MLLGRGAERRRIDALLQAARAGQGSALLVLGEPGIGKSALLADAIHRATGLTVLSARGLESESELPFSGLADVLRPLLDHLDELPPAQRIALSSALAIGEPAVVERFAVNAATLALLAAGAGESPLLVAVDDAHWLDAASLDAIAFAARRLAEERTAFLLTARYDDGLPPDLDRLELAGLDTRSARILLSRSPAPVSGPVADALVAASGGNPLALLELPGLISAEQLEGREALQDPLPLAPALERAFGRRLDGLSQAARDALAVAAAIDSDELAPTLRALAALGLAHAPLAEAEAAELIRIDAGRLRFRHPLIRAAAYQSAAPARRRAAHHALADALASSSPQRRAWHLAAAAAGPNEDVAQLLEDTAAEARGRSGYAAAARALELASQLSEDMERRRHRMLAAADNFRLAGMDERALALLDAACESSGDPLLRADVEALRGRIELSRAPTREAYDRLVAEAEQVEPLDPARAAAMFVDAAMTAVSDVNLAGATHAAAKARAAAQSSAAPLDPATALVVDQWVDDISSELRDRGAEQRWDALLERSSDLTVADRLIRLAAFAGWAGHYDRTRRLLTRIAEAARRASAGALLVDALAEITLLEYRASRWLAAATAGEEALRLAEDTGRTVSAVQTLVYLARMEGAQGREPECRAHVARAYELAEPLGLEEIPDWHGNVALGTLELGLGRPEQAIIHLEKTVGDIDREIVPGVNRANGELVEAYIRAGRIDKAERLLDVSERRARSAERPWGIAQAARNRGLLADEEGYESCFQEALRWHVLAEAPFDRARTELAYGERLRRARRRVEARDHLRSALTTFEKLGAGPWADRARAQLAASGERARKRDPLAAEQLTAQELQLAMIVAGGATNKEAAASLFISPKTVEAHLGSIYRKLGVRSRTELASRFAREQLSAA